MPIITIPKEITNGKELMIIPKEDWERILELAKKNVCRLKLEKGLEEALVEIKAGKLIGPFKEAEDLIKSLEK